MGVTSAFVGAATSVAGAIGGSDASSSAADAQVRASQDAIKQENATGQTIATNFQPYTDAGSAALSALRTGLGIGSGVSPAIYDQPGGIASNSPTGAFARPFTLADFNASPAYQFNLQQGQDAINAGAAARGNYFGAGTLKDLARFTQGLAGNEFQTARGNFVQDQGTNFNRLLALVTGGQGAASSLSSLQSGIANNVANLTTGIGNAQASGIVGSQNAINQGLSGVTQAAQGGYQAYLLNQMLQQQQGGNMIDFGQGLTVPAGGVGVTDPSAFASFFNNDANSFLGAASGF